MQPSTELLDEDEALKPNDSRRKLLAIGLTCISCWAFTYLGVNFFRNYASGLFIWLPIVLGATSTFLYGYNKTVKRSKLFGIMVITLLFYCMGLLLFAWEGIICLMMAFPIGLFFAFVGHWIGCQILRSKLGNATIVPALLLVSVPAFMSFENTVSETEVRAVTTSIEIKASPAEVWNHVIAFPQLKEPDELIFKMGIAYPINATIEGNNVGAVRRCNFSTGSFVEPIMIWDEPNLLRFSVTDQPPTMKELSVYDIKPNHLHGYWVSKQGQFKLTSLPNGNTLLEGTTWYSNKIKPDFYWSNWSDYIVHKIHRRVLNHIKEQAEKL